MSALAGLGIDNLHVDVAGPEVPIMDGSAGPFVFLLQSAGIEEQAAPQALSSRRVAPVEVQRRRQVGALRAVRRLQARLHDRFSASGVRLGEPATSSSTSPSDSYAKEVARARTFGFMQDVEAMRAAGLGLGGSLQNAIVLDEFKVLNSEGLRYDNEFVRHKVLDAIGDLYLLGHPLIGQYTAYKSGHALNNALARALLARADAFEMTTFADEKTFRRRSTTGACRRLKPVAEPSARAPRFGRADAGAATRLLIVRLLLFLAIATIAVALLLYLFKRDRRYLRFIVQVVKFTLLVLVGVLLFFAAERLLGPFLAPLL